MAVPLFHTGMSVLLYVGYLLCTVNPLFLPSGFHFRPGSLPAFRLSTPGEYVTLVLFGFFPPTAPFNSLIYCLELFSVSYSVSRIYDYILLSLKFSP